MHLGKLLLGLPVVWIVYELIWIPDRLFLAKGCPILPGIAVWLFVGLPHIVWERRILLSGFCDCQGLLFPLENSLLHITGVLFHIWLQPVVRGMHQSCRRMNSMW